MPMNKNKQFAEILDKCLERLRQGGSIEQCLTAYPDQAKELRPLLETVAMVKLVTAISPRPGLNAQLQQRLRTATQEKPKRSNPLFGWSPRWATWVGIALVLVMSGGSTVAAASSSMPDSVLYPVKQATEQVRLKLTFSDVGKEELYATLADVLVKELDYLSNKNGAVSSARTAKIEQVRRQLNTALDKVVVLASVPQTADGGVMTAPMMTAPPTAIKGDQSIDMTPSVAVVPTTRPQF